MATWQDFLRESRRFWEIAQLADASGYANQAVSNAVHAAITANDALCLFLIGERAEGQAHAEAARILGSACKGTEWERDATQRAAQLSDVLEQKNAAEYYGKAISAQTAQRVMKQAERFVGWVQSILPHPEVRDPERHSDRRRS